MNEPAERQFMYSHQSSIRLLLLNPVAVYGSPHIVTGFRYLQLPISEAGNPSMTIGE